jgi:hypothetical protein
MVQALRRATKGEWRFPAKLSIDVGRESAANMNENRQGAKSLQEIAAEEGTDAFSRLEQIAIEAGFVKELAVKYGVPETAIRLTTTSLPSTPAEPAQPRRRRRASRRHRPQSSRSSRSRTTQTSSRSTSPTAPIFQPTRWRTTHGAHLRSARKSQSHSAA